MSDTGPILLMHLDTCALSLNGPEWACDCPAPYQEITRLRAEIERLRAELRIVADECGMSGGEFWMGTAPMDRLPTLQAMYDERMADTDE